MDPKVIELLQEGQRLAGEGNLEKAADSWKQAINLSADDTEIMAFVVSQLADINYLEEAKSLVKQLSDIDPDKAAAIAAQTGLDCWEKYQDIVGALQLSGLSLQIAAQYKNTQQLAYTSGNLGNILSAAGSMEASLIHYENAGRYYRQIGDTEWQSMMLSSAGGVLMDLERYEEGERSLQSAIDLAESNGHDQALALALLNLGSIYGLQQQFNRSKDIHYRALTIAWKIRNAEYIQKSAGHLALDLRNLHLSGKNEADEFVQLCLKALEKKEYQWVIYGLKYAALLVDEKIEPIALADIYQVLSNVEFMVSELDGAVVHLQEACKLARIAKEDRALANYCAGLSHLYLEQGKLPEAAQACDEAIVCAGRSDADYPLSVALGNRGIVALKQDKLHLAERLFLRQYRITKDKGLPQPCANAANSLGAVYEKMGDILSAEKWFLIAIEESEDYKWPAGLHSLVNLAALQRQRGEIDEAIATYNDALIRGISNEHFDIHFNVLVNIGVLQVKKMDLEQARSFFQLARDWIRNITDLPKTALLDMNEAFLHLEEDDKTAALEKFMQANTFFKESDWKNSAKCAVEIAIILMESGRLQEALQQVLPPVELYEQRMNKLSDLDAWRIHREEERCFQVFMELALALFGAELALLAIERSRGRAFRLALRRREAGHRTQAFDYLQILRQTAFDTILSGRVNGLNKEDVDRFVQVLDGATDPLEQELSITWIREWAEKLNASFVVYAKGYPDTLHAWIIDQSSIHHQRIDLTLVEGLSGLSALIQRLQMQLGIPERGAGGLNRGSKDPNPLLHQLYRLLLHPIADRLPQEEGARVCFVPWGPLFEIPFCALQDEQNRYWVDRYASFVIPTLYFFGSQREEDGEGALVIGDPIPTQDSSFGPLSRLPFAQDEARQVAEIYEAEPLIGEEATKKKVLEKLPTARISHFAAHGLFDAIYPLRSSVALTSTAEDDGLLYAHDLKTQMLKSRLVVLSSCSSALGNITGDGVLGLCREFLAAGTDSIVASLWAVGDRSSAFHMTQFHKALGQVPVIEALRIAQLATKKEFGQVSQWGAYGLWGWPQ